ncbi:MAG: peptide deformylase [candidate division WWE3 bacterium]|nr:peptide deformylase [candidate division WWE3 bacterium]
MPTIITVPDKRLRLKSKQIKKYDDTVDKLIADLKTALINHEDPEGVGISAPQIGVNLQVFITKKVDAAGKPLAGDDAFQVFINPVITKYSSDLNWDHLKPEDHYYEGCLSVPGIYGEVTRPWSITVTYDQLTTLHCHAILSTTTVELNGLPAIYFQHEYDHLQGIIFTDLVLKQSGKLYELAEDGNFKEI